VQLQQGWQRLLFAYVRIQYYVTLSCRFPDGVYMLRIFDHFKITCRLLYHAFLSKQQKIKK